ncbi:hypothetical protein ACIHEI_32560 [Kitasatospora sp. NPDC051984]|uniref:hypothetical protein n=1 Tax=Kitasatospora sp. NPDC051984 TaxID=3364059 RepID=UPI0037C83DC0
MRTPEELHLVDWASLYHAYGDGTDVPGWIRALYSEDEAVVDGALDELFGRVLHQGSVYPASVAAVPYVAHAAVHAVHRRHLMLAYLAATGGTEAETWPGPQQEGCGLVAEELPGLLHLIRDPDPEVRRQAVRVARRATGDSLRPALDALTACHRDDPVVRVRAEALTVLSRLDADPGPLLRAALEDAEPAVRATAALALLEEDPTPELPAVLVADGGDPDFRLVWTEWFPGVGSTEDRLQRLINDDPELVHELATAWIAAGDHDGRGTRRALRLSTHWRGYEEETVALLLAALPHQREWYWRMRVLDGLADRVARCADPAAVAEAVLPHATDPDPRIFRPAQLALARAGDTRLLTTVPEPHPDALDALATRTDDLDLRRQALTPHPCPGGCGGSHSSTDELLDALTPESAVPLLPELTALLRTCPNRRLLHLLGELGLTDPELLAALDELAQRTDHLLAPAAAVAAARLGADPGPALRLLADRLATDADRLPEAALLGPAGAPLLPLVEPYLAADFPRTRVDAAEALWRITGDPTRAVPALLAEIAGPIPTWSAVQALSVLRRTGQPLPPGQRALVEGWRDLDPAVMADEIFWSRQDEERLHEEVRLLLDQQP